MVFAILPVQIVVNNHFNMNKYTLRFIKADIEENYQKSKEVHLQKPVMLGLGVGSIFLNALKMAFDIAYDDFQASYINLAFIIYTCVTLFLTIFKTHSLRWVLIVSSYLATIYQFNLESYESAQTSYLYGTNMMLLHTTIYIVQDFAHALHQILIQLIIRCALTVVITGGETDFQGFLFGVQGSIFLLIALYFCDSSQRKSFLQNLREDDWENHLAFIIDRPFVKFNFLPDKIQFSLEKSNKLELVPGYQEGCCGGCNLRNFLRAAHIGYLNLETLLFRGELDRDQKLEAISRNKRLSLRFCRYGVDVVNYLFIVDDHVRPWAKEQQQTITRALVKCGRLLKGSNLPQEVLYLNLLCCLSLNERSKIKMVSMSQTLEKYRQKYQSQTRMRILIVKQSQMSIRTYANLLHIFAIQLYTILAQMEAELVIFKVGKVLQIKMNNAQQFLEAYQNNYILQQIQGTLLEQPMDRDLMFWFRQQIVPSYYG